MYILGLISIGLSLYAISRVNRVENYLREKFDNGSKDEIKEKERAEPEAVSRKNESLDNIFSWFAHEWPLKTGAVLILLGFIWLVTYAFLNNWVGPFGRITFGFISGAAILYFGEKRLKSAPSQGITLTGLGSAVIMITVYAAQYIYKMFPPPVALLFTSLTMLMTAAVSLKYKVRSLAVFSLIIGGLAPLLIGRGNESIFGLYSYLLAVTAGVIWLAGFSRWKILIFLSMVIISLYSLSYFFPGGYYPGSILLPDDFFYLKFFAVTFSSLYFFTILTSVVSRNVTVSDLLAAAAHGFFTIGWINGIVLPEYKSLITLLATVFYLGATYLVFIRTQVKNVLYLYTAISVFLLTLAAVFEFQGPVLVIALSVQAAVLPMVALALLNEEIAGYLLAYFILPSLFSVQSLFSNNWNLGLFHNDFYALSAVTLAYLSTGLYFYSRFRQKEHPLHRAAVFVTIAGAYYGLFLLWKINQVLFVPDYIARMVSLLIYSMVGLYIYVKGELEKRRILYRFGLSVLILVVWRLLIFEVWSMEISFRIITFFLIGLMFIGSVILRKSSDNKK